MPRVCTVCSHPQRPEIDRAFVAGAAFPAFVSAYGVSVPALFRHKATHLPRLLAEAQHSETMAEGDDLLAQLRDLQGRTLRLLDAAEAAGKLYSALTAIREARGNLELLAKLVGELDERPVVNVAVSAEWLELRGKILVALGPFPQARIAVAEALGDAG